MKSKVVSALMLLLLFSVVLFVWLLNTKPVEASGTIYIRADGSVDPPEAPISTLDNITYIFTADIYDSIVVERDDIVVDGAGYKVEGPAGEHGICMDVSNVTIKNMEIKVFDYGIYLYGCSDIRIYGNNITDNGKGIYLEGSQNTISGNNITNGIDLLMGSSSNNVYENIIRGRVYLDGWSNNIYGNIITGSIGIILEGASSNNIYGNSITASDYGLSLIASSSNNNIYENNITNAQFGISATMTPDNNIFKNKITNNSYGIRLFDGSNNFNIYGNNITNNGKGISYGYWIDGSFIWGNNITNNGYGIDLSGTYGCQSIIVFGNKITNNTLGIRLDATHWSGDVHSSDNYIFENIIADNGEGVLLGNAESNSIHHNNFLGNTNHTSNIFGHINAWDEGYPDGGNYWGDYNGTDFYSGPNQDLTGSDGLGDTPYVIDASNQDHYPLMKSISLYPHASFVYTPSEPIINETVAFDASGSWHLDGHIVSYVWDFGDGVNSTETDPIVTHAYESAGLFNVTLTVIDNEGLNDTATSPIDVGKLDSGISITAFPTTITIGESIAINGSIIPTRGEVTVSIWYRLIGQGTWALLTNATTDQNSEYLHDWAPSEVGTYELKASWEGDEHTLPAETSVFTVVCMRIVTHISISTSCPSTFVGFKVNITGTLRDVYENSLRDETVVLYYTFSGILDWVPITSDTTDSLGNYQAIWIPPATGYFVMKAEWAGNTTHFVANSTTTLSSLPYQNQYVFSVESNSTISELAFNTTDWTLSFKATGPNGTRGYVKVTVAKSLVTNITNIRVYLDGNQSEYSITSLDSSWLLTFTYTHSTHQVVVDLGAIEEDTTPPTIVILSPENKTYSANDILLTFTVSEPASWIGHSLDGQMNVTITGNTTLTSLLDGSHNVVVYANDTAGNMGISSLVYFTVDTNPPNITDVSQIPLANNVLPEDEVKVNATVTDDLSGVKQVILNYTNGNGTWITVDMTNLEGTVWNATIPAFPYCTNVTYAIIAEDNVNNTLTTEELGYEYQYHVIPEFPLLIIALLFMMATLLAVIVYRRKNSV